MKLRALIAIGLLTFPVIGFSQADLIDPTNPIVEPNEREEQPDATDKQGRNGYWEANLKDGNYLVALGRISSVSQHKYVLDGALIVNEVTVDTTGQALVRFYHITPISTSGPGAAAADATERAMALLDGAARRAGTEVQDMVVKKFPLTTHAKNVEYRLLSEQQLNVLYQSVKTAWVSGKGRVFSER